MLEKKFLKAIKDFALLKKGDSVLIAFSGGIDSTVLATLLLKLKNYLGIDRISLAHLNHSLRKEADEDQKFCETFAREKGLNIYTRKVDVRGYASKYSMSVEEAARKVRYSFLQEVAQKEGFTKITTGHHLSDLVETMLLWFVQGNRRGIKGFRAKEGKIIRPLYYMTKDEIYRYASEKKIKYVVDRSNFKTDILRNKIRHNIIPLLKQINPSLEKSMLYEALFLQIDDSFLEEKNKMFSQKFLNDSIKLDKILDIPEAILYRMLTDWIYRKTGVYPSYRKIWEILNILRKTGEKEISLTRNYQLVKSYSEIFIKKKEKTEGYFYKIKAGNEVHIRSWCYNKKLYI
ncbi:MAG: tRNA lysidine(34) synthetase TilS [Persephonella sp.]|nr:tRNA lysidine(34) synthetase TilS [Persephonella sp.]